MRRVLCGMLLTLIVTPFMASAHEVYVLPDVTIEHAVTDYSPNPLTAIPGNWGEFIEWGLIVTAILVSVCALSYSRRLSSFGAPVLQWLKPYAHVIARCTLGASLFASGYYQAFFGPELAFKHEFLPSIEPFVSIIFMVLGVCIALGFLTRIATIIGLLFFGMAVGMYHSYMLTYINYCGELILMLILGSGFWALDNHIQFAKSLDRLFNPLHMLFEQYGFFILRVLFGIALIYASMYAKFIHSDLALDTVHDFNLTWYFPFQPLFLVLGACIIECLIGISFIVGFGIRFASVFFLTFLTMSLLFFGEAVWPHIILIGVAITLFFHGYDKYTLMMHLPKRQKQEPVF